MRVQAKNLTEPEVKARCYFAEAFFRTCPALQEVDARLKEAQSEQERQFAYGMALVHGINQSDDFEVPKAPVPGA